jgi:hypothetical protein
MAKRKQGTRAAPSNRDVIKALEKQPTTSQWFKAHPLAEQFVRDWIDMRAKAETTVGVRTVRGYLTEHFQFPFSHDAIWRYAADFLGGAPS